MTRVVTIVQARMGSQRLPGKVLAPVMGRPMLAYLLERLRRVRLHDAIAIATTTNPADDELVAVAEQEGCLIFRGSEDDVIARYIGAARHFDADAIAHVGADDPFCDPAVVDAAIALLLASRFAYVNSFAWPLGLNPLVFTRAAIEGAEAGTSADEREHLGAFWERRPVSFPGGLLPGPGNCYHRRITLDTPEDLEFHRRVIEGLYTQNPTFNTWDLLGYLDANPDIEAVNAHVQIYQWDRTSIEGGRAPEILRWG